jgi:hypothetical protein
MPTTATRPPANKAVSPSVWCFASLVSATYASSGGAPLWLSVLGRDRATVPIHAMVSAAKDVSNPGATVLPASALALVFVCSAILHFNFLTMDAVAAVTAWESLAVNDAIGA